MQENRNKNRNKQKKLDKASQKGSKVVFANSHQTKAMLDLSIQMDILVRKIQSDMGASISYIEGAEMLENGQEVILSLSDYINNLAEKVGMDLHEPATVTLLKNIKKV